MTIEAFEILGRDRPENWLVACDHATNRVPYEICGGSLGLSDEQMQRHIAYDIGAEGVSRQLGQLLSAPAILSRFSRLVIDPNRGEDDPTLIMKVYDQTIVPENRHISPAERERRLNSYYRPYHDAYAELAARQDDTIIVAVHSYTPQLAGRRLRPWHVGLLFGQDERLALPLLERLENEPDLCIGRNQPYAGHLPGDSVHRHGLLTGRANILIELRHDLIETEAQQEAWAKRLAPFLIEARAAANL
ncbi:MAG: N-formylglutamate amidohydrolase [Alphaproteobacteria bacterium]|nr:N-formylglutamate amidohydrolase [Alphaproteobacteria bacterium]